MRNVEMNSRPYRWMSQPLVVVCVGGWQYEYLTEAAKSGAAPFIGKLLSGGSTLRGDFVVSSFTNPNNLSGLKMSFLRRRESSLCPSLRGDDAGAICFSSEKAEEVTMAENGPRERRT